MNEKLFTKLQEDQLEAQKEEMPENLDALRSEVRKELASKAREQKNSS